MVVLLEHLTPEHPKETVAHLLVNLLAVLAHHFGVARGMAVLLAFLRVGLALTGLTIQVEAAAVAEVTPVLVPHQIAQAVGRQGAPVAVPVGRAMDGQIWVRRGAPDFLQIALMPAAAAEEALLCLEPMVAVGVVAVAEAALLAEALQMEAPEVPAIPEAPHLRQPTTVYQ